MGLRLLIGLRRPRRLAFGGLRSGRSFGIIVISLIRITIMPKLLPLRNPPKANLLGLLSPIKSLRPMF
jgi:hypothetical protein